MNFLDYCNDFIEELIDCSNKECYWYFQQNPDTIFLQILNYYRRLVGKISLGKIKINRPRKYNRMILSFPEKEKFYSAAKKFIDRIYYDLGINEHNLILDQFLLPHNLFHLQNYFNDNVRVFVVERDPRDVYLLNKYIWHPQGVAVPFPLNVSDFCKCYRKIRKSEKFVEDYRILRLHFEDLIYNYDSSIKKLYEFLGVNKDFHKYKKKYFNPEISIKNTHLFDMNPYWKKEADIIKRELEEYIYLYPETNIKHSPKDILF